MRISQLCYHVPFLTCVKTIESWLCFRACLVNFFKSLGKIQGTKITMHSGGRGEFFLLYSLIPISWKTWAYSIFLILIAYSKTTRFFIYGRELSINNVYWGPQHVGQEVTFKSWVTWLSFAQFVYLLRWWNSQLWFFLHSRIKFLN